MRGKASWVHNYKICFTTPPDMTVGPDIARFFLNLDLEEEGTTILQNYGNYSANNRVSHPRNTWFFRTLHCLQHHLHVSELTGNTSSTLFKYSSKNMVLTEARRTKMCDRHSRQNEQQPSITQSHLSGTDISCQIQSHPCNSYTPIPNVENAKRLKRT